MKKLEHLPPYPVVCGEFIVKGDDGKWTTLADRVRKVCTHLSEEEREARIAQAYQIYANGGEESEEQEP
jgi:hypothetical protein